MNINHTEGTLNKENLLRFYIKSSLWSDGLIDTPIILYKHIYIYIYLRERERQRVLSMNKLTPNIFIKSSFSSKPKIKISKLKLVTLVEDDPKAPFWIATTLSCRGGGHYSIPWIAPLYPWSLPYNAEC